MSENFTNTSSVKTNTFNKGMVKDYTDIYMSEGLWTNAINAINNTHYGETGSIGNEPSNKYCVSTPYTIIGFANITQQRWVLFSTNDVDSEIGIFDESDCSYTVVVNDRCLNFKRTHLINAVVKKNYDCTYSTYFVDDLNPDRALNLDRVPYKIIGDANPDPDCYTPQYSDELDCDALRLHPLVEQPCVDVKKAVGAGQLNNGSYMACIAYSENKIRLTDYSIPSVPQALWDHTGIGGGLEITIDNLDQNFEEYELVVIAVINQQTIAKKIGNYSIRQKNVTLDLFQQSLPTVDLSLIPLKSVVYEKSKKIFEVNDYLIRTGVTTQPYINYQQQANKILANWVAVEYPADYYWGGGNKTGYMRDEVYPFFIRWVYRTGARTASFNIPGRVATPSDTQAVSTPDTLTGETQVWQVYDTATKYNAGGTTPDGGVIVAKGQMGFWQSTERYPDDKPGVWGELCGKPIRHHKMPGNETIHIHNQSGDKIILLGVEFSNITHPVDENGVPIADIIGYEILRGSREGNRSVIAKGMFNNMLEYNIQGSSRKGLFQNYPYNDLRPDNFLTDDYSILENGSGNPSTIEGASKLNKYKRDIFSFHSVETSFIKPYLGSGAHVKIYTEERGTVRGRFEYPYKHPKHIILTDGAFAIAAVVGLGIAAVSAIGKTTVTGGQFPLALGSGSPFGSATRESGFGSIATDLINANILQGSSLIGAGGIAGSIAGIASIVASSAYYWGQGVNQTLDVIRNFSKPRQYLLQYNSHGFYSSYSNVNNSAVPAGLSHSYRRAVSNSGAKYIGSGVHDLDATYRINNLYRNKYVAVKLNSTLPDPASTTDTTKHRLKDGGVSYSNPNRDEVLTNTVAYYGALKVDFQNQYGQLSSVVQLPTGSCIYNTQPNFAAYTTDVIFGGDIYINRYTEKNPYFFFNTWMVDMPDKTEYDYRNYVNGPAPRYWVNLEDFDGQDFNVSLFPNGLSTPFIDFTTPSDFHRFDRQSSVSGALVVKNAYAYLFHNGVRDFFTESELNMAFRDYGENDQDKFYDVYGNSFNDLSTMFRSDIINKPVFNKYDLSLSSSKLFNNFASWGTILPSDYDPRLYSSCFEFYPNRAIYSLQQQDGLRRDNWRNFLPLNYRDFGGRINTIKSLNATGAMILFENAEPELFVGVDQLQTQGGVKVSIGDGGLFQGNLQAIVNADDTIGYANSISSRAAVNTPHGLFFVSQQSGKIMQYQGGIQEISRNGLKYWFNQNLPSKMLQAYPDYPLYDNPVAGIGVQTIYDPQYELVYFTKRDYKPLRDDLRFDDPSGVPYYICGSTAPPPPPVCVTKGVRNISTQGVVGDTLVATWTLPTFLPNESLPTSMTVELSILIEGEATFYSVVTSVSISPTSTSYSFSKNVTLPALDENGGIIQVPYTITNADSIRINVNLNYSCGEISSECEGSITQFQNSNQTCFYTPDGDPVEINSTEPVITNLPPPLTEDCTAAMDVAFVIDTTSSMDPTLTNLKNNISSIASTIAAKSGNNYRLALLSVTESFGNLVQNEVKTLFALNNILQFQTALNTLTAAGGALMPEPTDIGIKQILDGEAGAFRNGVRKVIIMITDALPSGNNDAYGPDDLAFVTAISEQAADDNVVIYPIAVAAASFTPQISVIHDIYADTTGGISYYVPDVVIGVDVVVNVTPVVSEIIENIECISQPDCMLSADKTTITLGQSVTITWDAGDPVSASLSGIGNVNPQGTLQITPQETVTYTLSSFGDTPEEARVCSITITVVQPVDVKCPCAYDDPACFEPSGWTVSYDPKNKQWVSFHSWSPTLVMPSYNHFFTINNNSIWRHNDRWDSFCNYYGTDHPWEVEYPVVTPNNITTLRNIEYTMDVYKFFNDGKDFHHVLDENFDRAVVFNSEQISGLLKLKPEGKNSPLDHINYPIVTPNGIEILYSKEENKFRFNQFWDVTKDRGEFTGVQLPMWNTRASGFQKVINSANIDYFKSTLEHKKFRHYGNSVILRKNVSGDKKMILKLTNSKHLNSSR